MVHSIQSMQKLISRYNNIVFTSRGSQTDESIKMVNYQDVRNGKPYAISKISPTTIEYGKVKNGLETEPLKITNF